MKIVFIVVGKTVDSHLQALAADYAKRIGFYVPFEVQLVPDLKNTKHMSEAEQKEREGELILKQLQVSDYLVLLDERGREFRSVDFAQYIQERMLTSCKRLCFLIGGPYGFSDAVYQRSNAKVSLSKMTFSHQMVRVIFLEQLYRAMTILKGEPYHHE